MAKLKRIFTCGQCGAEHPKWQGQCADCGSWNSLAESAVSGDRARTAQLAGQTALARLDAIDIDRVERTSTGLTEFDRVLGGGLVPGSVVLIGGDPGIGKSTLLLRALANMAQDQLACYVTGEESLDQIALRAERLGVRTAPVELMAETHVETIIATLSGKPPAVLVIDSVQTLYSDSLQSAPGSVSQLRECAAQLVRFAKTRGIATILVGHVTKEGTLAGPRVLEHMVDTVLYFESDSGSRYRIIRAAKNRFGAANEMGFFLMAADGFRGVLGATRRKPAVVAQEGTEQELVGPDKELEQPRHGCKSACF